MQVLFFLISPAELNEWWYNKCHHEVWKYKKSSRFKKYTTKIMKTISDNCYSAKNFLSDNKHSDKISIYIQNSVHASMFKISPTVPPVWWYDNCGWIRMLDSHIAAVNSSSRLESIQMKKIAFYSQKPFKRNSIQLRSNLQSNNLYGIPCRKEKSNYFTLDLPPNRYEDLQGKTFHYRKSHKNSIAFMRREVALQNLRYLLA